MHSKRVFIGVGKGRLFRAFAALTIVCFVCACSSRPLPDARPTFAPTDVPNPTMGPKNFRRGPNDHSVDGDDLVSVTMLVRRLQIPWGVTFLPDGSALVTERATRRILKLGPHRSHSGDLAVKLVTTVPDVYTNDEGGLLGIAASPSFAKDRIVFIYYTTTKDNRIARLRLTGSMRPRPIVTGIPGAGVHNGGRLAFGPDGYLYAATGDATRAGGAQHIDDLGGKILRMTTDGKPAPGNPFPHSLVWSYGHRNPEGIAWDDRGRMYSAEIGESLQDELNLILPGRNYGWPKVEGMGKQPGMVNPLVTWRPAIGASDGVVIVGRMAIVTCLRGQRIWLVPLAGRKTGDVNSKPIAHSGAGDSIVRWRPGAGVGRPIEALTGRYGRIRAATRAPDGSIWLTTSNRDGRNQPVAEDDRILRLTLRPSPTAGATPLHRPPSPRGTAPAAR